MLQIEPSPARVRTKKACGRRPETWLANLMTTSEALEKLALHCLKDTEVYKPRTGEDLENALIIFMDVFTPLVHDRSNILGLTMDQQCELMAELGKNLRQTVMLGTGIDMHDQVSGWKADL